MVNSGYPAFVQEDIHLEDLNTVAGELIKAAGDKKIWLLNGDMGAGKTTLIRALATNMGVEDNISSPTYGLVNEYQDNQGDAVYHFDFYRINDDSEAEEIGIAEYFDSGNYCFIEWPEKIERLLPDIYILVNIEASSPTTRRLELHIYE